MKHFTKSMLVLFAALFSFSMAFAETGTETEKDQKNGNKNTTAEGQSYTIDGTYIAGTGSTAVAPMTSKGLKFRTAQNGATLEFKVRENYTITRLYMAAIGNYVKVDASKPYITISKVEVDGAEVSFEGGEFSGKGEEAAGELTVANISAKEKIVLYFDNSNTNSGETQLNASWAIDWERPDATQPTITVTPTTLALVPGATSKLSVHVDPASFTTVWTSSDESVATVAEDGTVTAVAPGTATIYNQWDADASVNGAAVVTVAEFDPSAYSVSTIDFTTMGDVTLTIEKAAAGAIWNEGNNKPNDVFFCTNEGLENIAVQAVVSSNKGWSIKDGEGLVLASGAGRCAAVGNLKAGQIVEILYTGNAFYTGSKNDAVRKDDGAPKTALNEGLGRAIYQMDADGLLGFEIERGKAITKINIYSTPLIDAKAQLQEAIDKLKALGVAPLANAIAAAEAALNAEDATVASIAAAAKKLDEDVKKFGKDALGKAILLSAQLNDPDVSAAANTAMPVYLNDNATTDDYIEALFGILNAVQPKIDAYAPQVIEFAERYNYPDLKAAIEGLIGAVEDKDIDKVIAGATSMLTLIKETATDVKTKLEPYLEVLDDEELKADVEAIASLVNGSSTDFAAIIAAMQKAVDQFLKASAAFVAKVDAVVADGADDAKLIEALNNAKATLADKSSTIVQIGSAIQALIKAYKEYEIATGIETVSIAAQNAVVYDLQGRRVLNDRKGIFIINGKKVVIK